MVRYRKKPIVIEAIQFNGPKSISEMLDKWVLLGLVLGFPADDSKITIETLEGDIEVSIGDYIIKGSDDEFYRCKPFMFNKMYEKIEE